MTETITEEQKQAWIADTEQKLIIARRYIFRQKQIFGEPLARMDVDIKCSTGPHQMPAAATDCHKAIIVDARRIAQMTNEQVIFLMLHEVLHKMLKHNRRMLHSYTGDKHLDKQLTNIAQDFVINKIVVDEVGAGAFVPGDVASDAPIVATRATFWDALSLSMETKRPLRIYDPTITDKDSAESVMAQLLADMPKPSQKPQSGGQGDPDPRKGKGEGQSGGKGDKPEDQPEKGEGKPDPNAKPSDKPEDQPGKEQEDQGQGQDPDAGPGQGQGQGQDDPTPQQQMAAAMAAREMGDDSQLDTQPDKATGEVPDQQEVEAEQVMTDQAVAAAVEQAQKQRGKVPMGFERFMEAVRRPAINPRTLLEKYVRRRTARSDYSMRRLRKTGMAFNMMLPTLRSEEIGELIVAIDTSGSVGDRELAQYASDITAVQRIMKPSKTHIIYCDARVAGTQVFKRGQKVKLQPKGGGGTAFHPVFKHIKDNNMKSDLILYLTDGYAPTSGLPKTDAPIVWLVYDGARGFKPPHGDVVHVEIKG